MADDPVDALFALRPGDFTAARNDLARQLRAAGERERAKEVAGLRRPTVAAWAVNQAVRGDRDAYTALLDAGLQLRRAQRRALSGMAKSGLREASSARREHVERLAGLAASHLADAGVDPAAHRDDIVATFESASATDEAGEQVGAARLARPLTAPSTFEDLAALSVVGSEPAADKMPGGRGDTVGSEPAADEMPGGRADAVGSDERREPAGERADGGGRPQEDEADGRRRAAADALAEARRRAEEAASARRRAREDERAARRHADEAATEADDAATEADDAAAGADRARREAERAEREAERARREADRLQRRAEAAREEAQRRSDDAAEADRTAEDLARAADRAEERLRSLPT